jgi:predicted ATPase/DNA-binding SARP family transcriptional activator
MREMAAAEIRVLGPVELVRGDDGALPLAAKHRLLLAALVVGQGRTRTVDELLESVWSGSPPASARNLVQVYVSQLRKVLPDGIEIVTGDGAYVLELAPEQLDSARFERLLSDCEAARRGDNPALAASLAKRALALWRGRAFGDLGYEEFARGEAERLEELRLVALEEHLDARIALGRHAEVAGKALALAAENPLRERAHELSMLALYRCGRQADALEHFASLRLRLREQLGLEPGPGLRALQRRILQQDPSLHPATQADQPAAALPVPPTPLVGRERELAELAALLARRDARLIVLTGAGGSGKTRLALEAARRAAGSFANGVRLVELAPVHDSALLVPTIQHALGVADDADKEPLEALVAALAPQELLLVVDNAEHLRAGAPSFARLAAAAPRLTLLVTSRAVLHVSGERVFPVPPLAQEDAVELFVQRARLLNPGFARCEDNDADLREICRRLDGLPLAIELAAARIRTLTPRALRERLARSLAVLTSGPRDLPARQQTLRETIAWSVDLLGEREREVFARLAVFPGGATLKAAETVCHADLDTLAALVDDHLVLLLRNDARGEPRFGLLDTVREFGLDLLGVERAQAELALAEYFARFVDELRLSEGTQPEWRRGVEQLDPDIDNVRNALATAEASGDAQLFVRLAGGMWRYWWVRGPSGEGLDWTERALAADEGPPTADGARALYGGAALAWSRGDLVRAKHLAEAAISAAVDAGSEWYELAAHTVLGNVAHAGGDLATARRHHERSLELKVQIGLEPLVEKINLGAVALESGEHEEAMALFEDVVYAHRRDGNAVGIGMVLLNIGRVHHELGDHDASRHAFEEARASFEEVGFRSHVAYALQGLAAAEASEKRFEEAARLLGRARRELDDVGSSERGSAPAMVSWVTAQAQGALGHESFDAAYAAGREAG